MKTKKIGLDIDGVLADFMLAWHKLHPEIPRDPDSYDFDKNIKQRLTDMGIAGTLDDFYLSIEPLIKPEDIPFEVSCYVTARPVETKISAKWLKKCGFPDKPVYTVSMGTSKVEVMKNAGIDIFIDDYYENFVDLNNKGIFCYLYTAPWNAMYDVGHMRLNSLKEMELVK